MASCAASPARTRRETERVLEKGPRDLVQLGHVEHHLGAETSSTARDIDMYGVNCDDDEYCRVGLDCDDDEYCRVGLDFDMYGVNCDDDEYCRVGLDFGGRGWQVWG